MSAKIYGHQLSFFQNLINIFFGHFDPINIFSILQINNLWGDLTDISAKTATVMVTTEFSTSLPFGNAGSTSGKKDML